MGDRYGCSSSSGSNSGDGDNECGEMMLGFVYTVVEEEEKKRDRKKKEKQRKLMSYIDKKKSISNVRKLFVFISFFLPTFFFCLHGSS